MPLYNKNDIFLYLYQVKINILDHIEAYVSHIIWYNNSILLIISYTLIVPILLYILAYKYTYNYS